MNQQPHYSDLSNQSSSYSSEDQDGKYLTTKVQQKLLTIIAQLKNKDPTIYQIKQPIFKDEDFYVQHKNQQALKNQKVEVKYQDLVGKQYLSQSDQNNQQQVNQHDNDELNTIKENFKKKLNKQHHSLQNSQKQSQNLFKLKKITQLPHKSNQQKLQQFISQFNPSSQKLINNLWQNTNQLDKTDIFLRNYIINKKWQTSKYTQNNLSIFPQNQQIIDEQDEQRSLQMDQYECKYNFRYQQPQSNKIIQYPRSIPQSVRIISESRKDKRKKYQVKKKLQSESVRKQAQQLQQQKKQLILQKLNQLHPKSTHQSQQLNNNQQSSDFEHDWFFCDDCTKPLIQNQLYYICKQCDEYILCQQCQPIIFHKHKMQKQIIPKGLGPPSQQKTQKALKKLLTCKICRKKIPHYLPHYQHSQKLSRSLNIICPKCYDQSNLQQKKKYHLISPKPNSTNYQQLLQKNPQQIKQLTCSKDIQNLIDQYLEYDYQDIIGDGIKTKFKYINVKPQSYGLSDQQILYGDDQQLNKYISIKKIRTYQNQQVKLRNNLYNRKIKSINQSVKFNKEIVKKQLDQINQIKYVKKKYIKKNHNEKIKANQNSKFQIIHLNQSQNQQKFKLSKSRLESYGLVAEENYNQIQKKNIINNSQKKILQK